MSVSVKYQNILEITETITTSYDLAGNAVVSPVHKIDAAGGTRNAGTTPAAVDGWSDRRALVAGADSIDLAALTGAAGLAKSAVGYKLQNIRIRPLDANSNPITFAKAAVEGYSLFGDADGELTLYPGMDVNIDCNGKLAEIVNNTNDKIDVSGTGTEGYDIILVWG